MREYTENGKGMIVVGILCQGLRVSSFHPLVAEIYTNAMSSAHNNIGRFHLTRVNLEFTESIVNLVVLLELIQDGKLFLGDIYSNIVIIAPELTMDDACEASDDRARRCTIQHADRIIYLDGGKIAEEGTYEELISKNGLFAALVERQRLDVGE